MGASFKDSNGITADGAGYKLNRKIWNESAERGVRKTVKERLKLFGRPVSAAQLSERVSERYPMMADASEFEKVLMRMVDNGEIRKTGDGYCLF